MAVLAVTDKNGKKTESIELPDAIFNPKINTKVIHQAVVMYQASLREGNASTKERADVSGGGRKPYRQKGTGRARAGSSRSPLWRGGGTTFGPHPRDFSYTLPKKIRTAALRESLNVKYQDNNILCVEDLNEALNKTKEFAGILKNLNLNGKILAILDGSDPAIQRVSQNIARLSLMRSQDVNAYDVMRCKKILVSRSAITNLITRVETKQVKTENKE